MLIFNPSLIIKKRKACIPNFILLPLWSSNNKWEETVQ